MKKELRKIQIKRVILKKEVAIFSKETYNFIREHSNEFAVESYHYNKKRIERLMKETRKLARRDIFEYIGIFYNRICLHSSLDYKIPEEYLNYVSRSS